MKSKMERKCLKYPRSIKFACLGIFLVSAVMLLLHTGVSKNIWLTYNNISSNNMIVFPNLGEKITPCFLKTALNESGMKARDFFVGPAISLETIISKGRSSFFYMNFIFNKILASLNIKAAIIEPSVLYCMLQPEYKILLKRRNATIAKFSEMRMTYGIYGSDVALLEKDDTIRKFRRWGYQPLFHRVPSAEWMPVDQTDMNSETHVSHIFYLYYDWIIHVVVFHRRNNYLWHEAFDSGDESNLPEKEDLLFVEHDSAFEKFSFKQLDLGHSNLANIYVPSNSEHFLFQIPSSRFLECNESRAASVNRSDNSSNSRLEEFNKKFSPSLRELKALFNALLMDFWIFSGTMLGWYRECGVIPYTSDIDFGAWASEVDNLDYIIKYFRNNKNLTIRERMGMLEEALEFQLRYQGLRVDVFFLYEISNGSWASGHRPSKGYYFRYHYPPFTLCSAELLGERVNVPCETEDVIIAEYGPKWMTPVKSWYYETSIKNRGPNIYWNEERRKDAFEEY